MKFSFKTASLGILLFALPSFAESSDGLITAKTKMQLWTTAGLRSTDVHVDTTDGVVTLHGKVPTQEQKDLAESSTKQIEGVRVVNDLIQVVPKSQEAAVARNDKEVSDAATKVLKNDKALKNSSISVKSVDKGVVLLTGKAASYGDHLQAIAEVDRVPGVVRVATEVTMPADYTRDETVIFMSPAPTPDGANDSRISMAVKMRLWTAPMIPSTEIAVDTDNGVVTLFGIVPSTVVRDAAIAESKKVTGVRQVDNQLQVVASSAKPTVDAKDADISRDLALTFKDRPAQKNVTTSVKNGTVQLKGTVTSGWAEFHTVRLARSVPGVRGIENQLKIETPRNN